MHTTRKTFNLMLIATHQPSMNDPPMYDAWYVSPMGSKNILT